MRTYYELEAYHYEEIKEAGYEIGDEVFCVLDFNEIIKGKIKKFDISIEGDIQFIIEYEKIAQVPTFIWRVEDRYNVTRTVYMFEVSKDKNIAIDKQIKIKQNIIKRHTEIIKYEAKNIKKLTSLKLKEMINET